MKLLLALALFSCTFAKAPDTISIKHSTFITTYDTVKKYPILVQWWITKSSLTCNDRQKRAENFRPDPLLYKVTDLDSSYAGSGYDRGHNMSAYDNGCDPIGQIECFFYSNMTPQTPSLNRGDWKTLEEYTRKKAMENDSIYVWCGSIGTSKKIKGLSIPTKCWKILYYRKTRTYEAFLFNNDKSKSDGITNNRTTCGIIYKLSGIKIMGRPRRL